MKVIDLLNKIANGEIRNDTILDCNGFFHYVIVIDEELYFINTIANELQVMSTKYICESFKNNYDFEIINPKEEKTNETQEEDKKIEKLNTKHFFNKQRQLASKINEIIEVINERTI